MNDMGDDDNDRERQLNEALAEYYRCLDRAQFVDRQKFVQQYPQLAPDLEQLLEAASLVEYMAGEEEESSDSGSHASGESDSYDTTIERPGPSKTAAWAHVTGEEIREGSGTSLPGRIFGDYEILETLGQGGMGIVYRARQKGLDRFVAVKMIRSEASASDTDVERFLAEAHAAGCLGHPNIVQVHEVGTVQGQHFYSMEFVDGTDLAHLARPDAPPLDSKRIARYVRDVALAIQYAHEHHIVHRDLKPANVIVDAETDRPLVTDFGLAKDILRDRKLTASSACIGTPSYMSPEQASGRPDAVGPAADIYSLGAILYELITRRPPFRAGSTVQTILDVISKEPVAPHAVDANVDRQLEAICLKCLRKEPRRRYATAQQLADDLTRYINGEPVLAHPKGFCLSCWHWLRNIPVIAAIVGRRFPNPRPPHLYAQWGLIIGSLAVLAVVILFRKGPQESQAFPQRVRIAAGKAQWEYKQFAESFGAELRGRIAVPVEVLVTEGAMENSQLLAIGDAEAALMQAGTFTSHDLAVVSPAYEEYLYFVVRVDRNIRTVRQLSDRNVVVGLEKSGMRVAAERVLEKLRLSVRPVHGDFGRMLEMTDWEAAIITTGSQNMVLRRILMDERFALLSLNTNEVELLNGPEFQPHVIPAGHFAAGDDLAHPIPDTAVQTVTTMTLLVVHRAASSALVRALLNSLYGDPLLGQTYDLVPMREAAQWQFFPLHPAAREFYNTLPMGPSGTNRPLD